VEVFFLGGPEGDRTLDLCVANAALSQLSYRPSRSMTLLIIHHSPIHAKHRVSFCHAISSVDWSILDLTSDKLTMITHTFWAGG
jgi:hypothetical protein